MKAVLCIALLLGLGAPAATRQAPQAPPVRIRTFHFVDRTRSISLPDGRRVPRPVTTIVRYPATGGPYPLVVFGHGFALGPGAYAGLLQAWARAGFVVAAPIFPLGNAHAPGGPNEADLLNQPRDLSFAITRLLHGPLRARIDASRIAVAGHSDGAETALAAAYDRRYRDRRVRAAIVLSGAALPGMGPFPRHGPPLLAVQGTDDPINRPVATSSYFRAAHRPKFLLWLLGASHLPPYTEQPQLGIVERATIAFLDHYLERAPLSAFTRAARRPGLTRLVADP